MDIIRKTDIDNLASALWLNVFYLTKGYQTKE